MEDVADPQAEILCGNVFHLVRLVEDHGGILRDESGEFRLLQSQVGEKEVVIDDDQV